MRAQKHRTTDGAGLEGCGPEWERWLARQVAWQRRLLELARRAESRLHEASPISARTSSQRAPALAGHSALPQAS
jgi:hypothetical protein